MAIAIIAFIRLGPRMATRTSARSRLGKAKTTSIILIMKVSTLPLKKPAIRPKITPTNRDTDTTIQPMNSEYLEP